MQITRDMTIKFYLSIKMLVHFQRFNILLLDLSKKQTGYYKC